MDEGRWQALMHCFGVEASLDTYQQLVQAYAEPHRYYHTAHHINACLQQFDLVCTEARALIEVEMALWFHDACYQPQSQQNEEDSADWARRFLQEAGVAEAQCQRVHDLIMATQDHGDVEDIDAALVVDIDLAILGEDAKTFAAFEANIRREYHWVPIADYCHRRSQILARFLQRPQVYQTPYFQVRYDAIARTNLKQTLSNLQNGILPA
ncbi:MAG: hypothetical protein HC851_12915 [Acaryochloris sp. RU_4_1]|nr:hypothetical protein [Acaryochloris sp. RU_4_1]NJR55238.1 hypothetical protein [Acaryochloris sp. CRU_2_0]